MRNLIVNTIAILIVFIFPCSCASTYKPINPPLNYYSTKELQDGISLSYKYEVLREYGNKKYAKKEFKKGLKVVAVKITNNTDTTIFIGQDVGIYSGENQLRLIDPMAIKNTIKQSVVAYLPYLLLSFLTLNVTTETSSDTYPIGLAIGPGITIGNMAVSSSANNRLFDELVKYNLINKAVASGETVYGIIGIQTNQFLPLTMRFIDE